MLALLLYSPEGEWVGHLQAACLSAHFAPRGKWPGVRLYIDSWTWASGLADRTGTKLEDEGQCVWKIGVQLDLWDLWAESLWTSDAHQRACPTEQALNDQGVGRLAPGMTASLSPATLVLVLGLQPLGSRDKRRTFDKAPSLGHQLTIER